MAQRIVTISEVTKTSDASSAVDIGDLLTAKESVAGAVLDQTKVAQTTREGFINTNVAKFKTAKDAVDFVNTQFKTWQQGTYKPVVDTIEGLEDLHRWMERMIENFKAEHPEAVADVLEKELESLKKESEKQQFVNQVLNTKIRRIEDDLEALQGHDGPSPTAAIEEKLGQLSDQLWDVGEMMRQVNLQIVSVDLRVRRIEEEMQTLQFKQDEFQETVETIGDAIEDTIMQEASAALPSQPVVSSTEAATAASPEKSSVSPAEPTASEASIEQSKAEQNKTAPNKSKK